MSHSTPMLKHEDYWLKKIHFIIFSKGETKMRNYSFTSESFTEGHPDKISDQISDAVVDAVLSKDPNGRVAIETSAKNGGIHVFGELTTSTYVDVPRLARGVLRDIGYTKAEHGIEWETCAVEVQITEQSPDISQGVDIGQKKEQGAGDQGMMFGYACRETNVLMPAPIMFAHGLTRKLAEVRKNGEVPYLRPDGKSQITFEYDHLGHPKRITAVVLAAQHDAGVDRKTIEEDLKRTVIMPVCGPYLDSETQFFINATGAFVRGGPYADAGLTGRKIIVDTYGGMGRHGGGAFSGKDPSKVDRSGAYAARYIAKNIVAAELAERCEVQIAYAIGVADPVSLFVNTFGTGTLDESTIEDLVREHFPLKPRAMIEHLNLLRPIYQRTAAYGHFGREKDGFTWELTDKAEVLKASVKKGSDRSRLETA